MSLDSFHLVLQLAIQLHRFRGGSRRATWLVGLQIAGVEGGMEGAESSLQIQLVGHWSYALEDLEWAHPARVELPGAWQAEVLGGEQHLVANLELLVAMVGIIVPLLVCLSLL